MHLSLLMYSSVSSYADEATQINELTINNLKLKTETRMVKATRTTMVRNLMKRSFAMNSKCQTTIISKMEAGTDSNINSILMMRTKKSSASN